MLQIHVPTRTLFLKVEIQRVCKNSYFWNEIRFNSALAGCYVIGFGTWVPGLVEPGFQNLGFQIQVQTTFVGGRVVQTQVE